MCMIEPPRACVLPISELKRPRHARHGSREALEAKGKTRPLTPLDANMLRALKLQGVAEETVDAYARAVRRTSKIFHRCPDDLSAEDLRVYFAKLLETHSWSTIKLDRCGLQFFYRHVLDQPWTWTTIVKPPRATRRPDVLTRGETLRLLGLVRKLRYRVFVLTLYSTGLRLSEGLALEVGDIDAQCLRLHVRVGKGNQDRDVPITAALLKMLRQSEKEGQAKKRVKAKKRKKRVRACVLPLRSNPEAKDKT